MIMQQHTENNCVLLCPVAYLTDFKEKYVTHIFQLLEILPANIHVHVKYREIVCECRLGKCPERGHKTVLFNP